MYINSVHIYINFTKRKFLNSVHVYINGVYNKMIPKKEKAIEKSFERCKKTFVQINKENYLSYREEALSDLNSAYNELKEGSIKWAIVKAYQALFLQCTAVLVKNLGLYSKDHGCLLIALLKNNLLKQEIVEKVESIFNHKKTLYEEIESIRIFRNKALYFPKTQNIIGKEDAEKRIEEVRKMILALGEQL